MRSRTSNTHGPALSVDRRPAPCGCRRSDRREDGAGQPGSARGENPATFCASYRGHWRETRPLPVRHDSCSLNWGRDEFQFSATSRRLGVARSWNLSRPNLENTRVTQRERTIQDLFGDWTRYRFAPPVQSERPRRRRSRRAPVPATGSKRPSRSR